MKLWQAITLTIGFSIILLVCCIGSYKGGYATGYVDGYQNYPIVHDPTRDGIPNYLKCQHCAEPALLIYKKHDPKTRTTRTLYRCINQHEIKQGYLVE